MTNEPNQTPAPKLFGDINEADRMAALDLFGRTLIEARDRAIRQWDQIIDGGRTYPPWERILQKFPEMDERARDVVKEVIPHIVDTFMYCLLSELDANRRVRVAVTVNNMTVDDVSRISWGLAGEPTLEQGWLVRFSKQRFEQPI